MMKAVEVFEAQLTQDVTVDPIVDLFQNEKFIRHHLGYKKGDTVTVQRLKDKNGKTEYVIPSGTFRCDGLAGVDPNKWQTSSRGAATVPFDCFVQTPKKRSIGAVLRAWTQGTSK